MNDDLSHKKNWLTTFEQILELLFKTARSLSHLSTNQVGTKRQTSALTLKQLVTTYNGFLNFFFWYEFLNQMLCFLLFPFLWVKIVSENIIYELDSMSLPILFLRCLMSSMQPGWVYRDVIRLHVGAKENKNNNTILDCGYIQDASSFKSDIPG